MATTSTPTLRELLSRASIHGPSALDDSQALRALGGLSAATAAALLAEFGSLPEVLSARPAVVARRSSPRAAARLALARDLALRALRRPLRARDVLTSSAAVETYLRSALRGRTWEEFHVLFLDTRNRLIKHEVMGHGTIDHAPAYPREVLRRALELDAAALIVAHNHPSADPNPSPADKATTLELAAAGRALRVLVHDHLLVAGDAVVSFRALGLL